jgi:hypothetical protein
VSRRGPDEPDLRIAWNRARFDQILARAEVHLAAGRIDAAATMYQVAAALAWHSPTGLFASQRLEHGLTNIAHAIPSPAAGGSAASSETPRAPADVLHVLTAASVVGGHTRLVRHWIESDTGRRHSIALTRQGSEAVPDWLLGAVRATGGHVHRIDRMAGTLTARATALATVFAAPDVVVLHTHPFDVVPSIAAAHMECVDRRPPTILLNHADHLFWVGLAASDLVVHLRRSGARLSGARRALTPDRSAILPVPLGSPTRDGARSTTRLELGYRAHDVVALTIASGYKYGPPDGPGLLTLLEEALEQMPELSVLAVGPGDRSDWLAAARRWGRRLRPLGVLPDVGTMYDAADIYVDSFPFSSLTSMLEAGQRSLPLIALGDKHRVTEVLHFDDPATEAMPIRLGATSAFLSTLETLVNDAETRRARGAAIELALRSWHTGERWLAELERVYSQAHEAWSAAGERAAPPATDPMPSRGDVLDLRLLGLLDAQQAAAPAGMRGHLRIAPYPLRLEEWWLARRTSRPLSVLVLVPEGVIRAARPAVILARHIRAAALRRRRPLP